jgi:hypothetical protein
MSAQDAKTALVARQTPPPGLPPETLAALDSIQRRVRWLATNIIHHANNVKPNHDNFSLWFRRQSRRNHKEKDFL